MRLFFTLLIFLFTICPLLAQERTISGRLTSNENGEPLPGVNIIIKGTDVGTVTDVDGYYSLKVPIGATLIFSFIGMRTREVVVTENNLQSANSLNKQARARRKHENHRALPASLYKDTTYNVPGVAVLTDETPSYNNKSDIDPATIKSIKRFGHNYVIKSDNDPVKKTGVAIQFTSSWGIEKINHLPSLQNQFAQGQPVSGSLQWIGPDQQETFSWGPLISTMEFDGSNYSFDKNGRLVPINSGNGKAAKSYDALSFFRTGSTSINELTMTMPTRKSGTFIFDFEKRNRNGVIPNSNYGKINVASSIKNYRLSRNITTNTSVSFNQSGGNLLNRGANMASIIGSVYRTPPTFDNANGLSTKNALRTTESYQLSDATIRSHAPGLTDNPFGLVNTLPDHEKLQRLLASLNLHYDPSNSFSLTLNGNLDRQWSNTGFGIPPVYAGDPNGRLTQRNDNQIFTNIIITPSFKHNYDNGELKLNLSYQNQYANRQLNREDGFGFSNDKFDDVQEADSIITLHKNLTRIIHEIVLNAQFEYSSWLNVRLTSRNYFSNTIKANQYLIPAGSFSVDLANLLNLWPVELLKIHTSIARTIREAPLVYSNWAYGSTRIPIEKYNSFYETNELFFITNLKPESERKFETGLKFRTQKFTVDAVYYNNQTTDFIVPVLETNSFELQNVATINNYGGTIAVGYSSYMRNVSWGIDLRWSKYTSITQQIYNANDPIPLAGFESTQGVLAAGKPVGAIYGTSYLRNSVGKKIIGDDGFPIEDTTLKMIGNPIPDWTLGLSPYIKWKQLAFSMLVDFKKGGDVWNGTNAALDYLGRSSNTANLRNTSNYIFDGVNINDNTNTTAVSFADPTKPISENRWVRYGWNGISEDYIEDASWIRLNELTLSYTIKQTRNGAAIKEIKFSLVGRNLFLFTPYSGVDPSITLYGNTTGNGLDLFNTPATRSYHAQITIKI